MGEKPDAACRQTHPASSTSGRRKSHNAHENEHGRHGQIGAEARSAVARIDRVSPCRANQGLDQHTIQSEIFDVPETVDADRHAGMAGSRLRATAGPTTAD